MGAVFERFKLEYTLPDGEVCVWSGTARSPEDAESSLLKTYPGATIKFLPIETDVDFVDQRIRAEMIEVSSIKVGDRFRKKYENIENLADSIRKYGLIHFIVIDDKNNLIAGGRRLEAVKLLGWNKVQCVRKQNINPLRLREMELDENIQREDMSWQEEVALKDEIARIKIEIYGQKGSGQASKRGGISQNDVAEMLGESPANLSMDRQLAQAIKIIPELANCKTKDEARKQLKGLTERAILAELTQRQASSNASPTSKLGFAGVSYMLGDAIEELKKHTKGNFNFINVDSPYGVDLDEVKGGDAVSASGYVEWDKEEFLAKSREVATELFRISENCYMLWWFGMVWYDELLTMLEEVGWKVDKVPGIWCSLGAGRTNKPNILLGRAYEPFFICWKGNPVLVQRGHSNVFMHKGVPTNERIHPTEKPVELMEEIYSVFTSPGSNIISPFLGSGNDIIAAINTGRSCKGWDLNNQSRQRFLVRAHKTFGEDNGDDD